MSGNAGADLLIGGTGGDWAYGDDASASAFNLDTGDIVVGDQARVGLTGNVIDSILTTERSTAGAGGADKIVGANGDDILIGGNAGDFIDGGDAIRSKARRRHSNDDLIFGDNVKLHRRADGLITDPRFAVLMGQVIYGRSDLTASQMGAPAPTADNSGAALILKVGGAVVPNDFRNLTGLRPTWAEWQIDDLDHDPATANPNGDRFGDDYIAGGNGDDVIFGQLGNDVIQGDASIESAIDALGSTLAVGASRSGGGSIALTPTLTAPSNGTLNLVASYESADDGDDYIEGNGGSDVIFGNLGQDDIVGGSSSSVHADEREPASGRGGHDLRRRRHARRPQSSARRDEQREHRARRPARAGCGRHRRGQRQHLPAGRDQRRGGCRVPAFRLRRPDARRLRRHGDHSACDRAARLHPGWPGLRRRGRRRNIGGDDEVHGESGDDTIYGMKGRDLLFGDSEDDDIIGGWGADWISGGTGQDGVIGDDGRIFTSRNGAAEPLFGIGSLAGQLSAAIETPGKAQQATINIAGDLKKSVDITPFNLTPVAQMDDPLNAPLSANDVIFGGLGRDFLHGGAGDDAISGAEALPEFFSAPTNPGDVLRFGSYTRAGEFADYDEYQPLKRLDPFLLNFNASESDGDDAIFGDLGNDWLVGGTGRDNLYGGWGNDLLDADDDKGTNGGLNDAPDGPNATYEDRAYGGAGRDVLIANTGGDRLIDWVGEFNSYIVPFAPFGIATVSRTLQPQLPEFLYALSASDGADPTRTEDGGAALRNGEPRASSGWCCRRTRPGTTRPVLRSIRRPGTSRAGSATSCAAPTSTTARRKASCPTAGRGSVASGRFEVAPATTGGDAVSVFLVDSLLPSYTEVSALINAVKPVGGNKANAYIVFDYQSKTNFKFAGINISTNKVEMGQRTAAGWTVLTSINAQLKPDTDYNVLLSMNGSVATIVVDSKYTLSYAFQPRIDQDGFKYGLTAGMVGLGAQAAGARIDNVAVQVLPRAITYEATDEFAGSTPQFLVPQTGSWSLASGRYSAQPAGSAPGLSIDALAAAPDALVLLEARLATTGTAGILFDYYSATDFKWATISSQNQVQIGYYTAKKGWVTTASTTWTIGSGVDHTLSVSLKGTTVSVSVDGQAALGNVFYGLLGDGKSGLLVRSGSASFDRFTVKTDDLAYGAKPAALMAASLGDSEGLVLSGSELAPVLEEAIGRWNDTLGLSDAQRVALGSMQMRVTDLPALTLAETQGMEILVDVDAAGNGWFVDPTPARDEEFRDSATGLTAKAATEASRHIDLLTVIAHELGHALGFDHTASGLMAETLSVGEREVPRATIDLRAIFAGEGNTRGLATQLASPAPALLQVLQADRSDAGAQTAADRIAIDWGPSFDRPFRLAAEEGDGSVRGNIAWVSDFVVNLGQREKDRNPNAELRVLLPSASKAPSLEDALNAVRKRR